MKKHLTILIIIIFTSLCVSAQEPSGFFVDNNADDINDNASVDGGLGFLIVAGVGYGIKKLYSKK
jgi:hypothetical protein